MIRVYRLIATLGSLLFRLWVNLLSTGYGLRFGCFGLAVAFSFLGDQLGRLLLGGNEKGISLRDHFQIDAGGEQFDRGFKGNVLDELLADQVNSVQLLDDQLKDS